MEVYLDTTEQCLMDANFGFTGSTVEKPDEGLVQLVEVDEELFTAEERPHDYVIFRRRDGVEGDQAAYEALLRERKVI